MGNRNLRDPGRDQHRFQHEMAATEYSHRHIGFAALDIYCFPAFDRQPDWASTDSGGLRELIYVCSANITPFDPSTRINCPSTNL
jgi:hypothetical protein